MKRKIGFQMKMETDILAMVIIEAIQGRGCTGIGRALSGDNDVYNQ
jgi:hypothetical protein